MAIVGAHLLCHQFQSLLVTVSELEPAFLVIRSQLRVVATKGARREPSEELGVLLDGHLAPPPAKSFHERIAVVHTVDVLVITIHFFFPAVRCAPCIFVLLFKETMTRYVLYINRSYSKPGEYCAGSVACLEAVGERADVAVQDVDAILAKNIELPTWLTATPCVVDTETSTAVQGGAAVQLLAGLPKEAPALPVDPVDPVDPVRDGAPVISDRDLPKVTDDMVEELMKQRTVSDNAQVRGTAPQPESSR